jgi:phenylacetate-CoA ligase
MIFSLRNFVFQVSGFDIKNAKLELIKLNKLSNSEFKIWHNNKKIEIVKYHYNNNNFYKSLCKNGIDLEWDALPVLKKSDFQRPLKEILSNGYNRKNTYISNTSGSSGTPLFFAKSKYSHAMTWEVIRERYRLLGLKDNSRQARFYGIPLNKVSYFSERLKDWILNRYRFVIFDLSEKELIKLLDRFKKENFEYIYGYTNSLILFARFLIRKNIILKNDSSNTLKMCITTAEQCTEEDKLILQKAFGIPIINEYGVSEVDIIAINDNLGKWVISNELIHVEIVDDNYVSVPDGTIGNILLTSLHNKAMPFIRYEVGDRGAIKRNSNDKYDELLMLSGRLNDFAKLSSGKLVPGFTLYYVSRSILENSGVLKEYVIKQTSLNEFLFEVVTDQPLDNNIIELIKETMYEYLEPGINVFVKRVEFIDRQSSGKLKHFQSLI